MKHIIFIFIIIASCIVCGCERPQFLSNEEYDKSDVVVSNDMTVIMSGLYNTIGEDSRYPEKLSDVIKWQTDANGKLKLWAVRLNLNSNNFVAPQTGSRPGNMSNVDDWTDYIYVGNNKDTFVYVPTIISPPENHGGKYGYAFMPGEGILKLPADQVRDLINQPWLLATNETPDNIEIIKRNIVVNVPPKLRAFYPNVNNWSRSLAK